MADTMQPENNTASRSAVHGIKSTIPRGIPKSGRVWKMEKHRFKAIIRTRGLLQAQAFQNQMKLKEDIKRLKAICRDRAEERAQEKEARKQRRRQNLENQKQNARKAEVVQVIKNAKKLKRLKKKEMRQIEKRDVLPIPDN